MRRLLSILFIFMFGFALGSCSNENSTVIYAEFNVDASDEEIVHVIREVADHPLVSAFEYISRYAELERISEIITDDTDDETKEGLLTYTDIVDLIRIVVDDSSSGEEVLEFVDGLDSIDYVLLVELD